MSEKTSEQQAAFERAMEEYKAGAITKTALARRLSAAMKNENRLCRVITLRLQQEEFDAIHRGAREAGESVNSFVRRVLGFEP